jgi:hypothetical protein
VSWAGPSRMGCGRQVTVASLVAVRLARQPPRSCGGGHADACGARRRPG